MRQLFAQLKKYQTYIILGIIVFAIIYSLVHRLRGVTTSTPGVSPSEAIQSSITPSSVLPTPIASSEPTQLIPDHQGILYPSYVSSSRELYYYYDAGSQLVKRNIATGQETVLLENIVFVQKVAWAPNHGAVLLQLENTTLENDQNSFYQKDLQEGRTFVALYTFNDHKLTRLNNGIVSFDWLDNSTVIYQYQDDIYNNLSIANPNGTNWKNIATLHGDIKILQSEGSALVQTLGEPTVTRYSSQGRRVENFAIPSDLVLDQSQWQANSSKLIYWVFDGTNLIIKHSANGVATELARLNRKPDQLSILWDNVNSDIYLAGFDGLVKLDVKAGVQ